jgi:hypothetical protein
MRTKEELFVELRWRTEIWEKGQLKNSKKELFVQKLISDILHLKILNESEICNNKIIFWRIMKFSI